MNLGYSASYIEQGVEQVLRQALTRTTHLEPLQMQRFTCDGSDYDQRYLMTKIQSNRRKIHILGGRDLKDTTAVGECNEKPRLRGSETAAVNRPRERVAPEV